MTKRYGEPTAKMACNEATGKYLGDDIQ